MQRKELSFLVIASLMAPAPARAEPTSVERFTQSLVEIYVAAEMCKNIKTLHSENYSVLVRNYLASYFQTEIPYWVLPNVKKRLKNRDNCVFAIEKSLSRYQQESVDYSADFPEQPIPPPLEGYMMVDSRSYTVDSNKEDSDKEHHITPTIVTRN